MINRSINWLLLSVVLANMFLINFTTVLAVSSANIHIDINSADRKVTISGDMTNGSAGQKATVLVLFPDKTVEGLKNKYYDLKQAASFVGETSAFNNTEQGGIRFQFQMFTLKQGSPVGEYTVYLMIDGQLANEKKFYYASIDDIRDTLNTINVTEVSKMGTEIIDNARILGADITDYGSLTPEGLTFVHGEIAKMDFSITEQDSATRVEEVRKKYVNALYELVSIAKFNEASDAVGVAACISKYNNIYKLKIGENDLYGRLTINGQNDVKDQLSSRVFSSISELVSAFNEEVVFTALYLGQWGEAAGIIAASNDILGLSLDKFNTLEAYEKDLVYKEMVGISFHDKEEVQNTFEQAIQYVLSQRTDRSKPSGSGNSGSTHVTLPSTAPSQEGLVQPPLADSAVFDDTADVSWANEAINTLAKKGIIIGESGHFYPNVSVTRAEFVKMIILAFSSVDQDAKSDYVDLMPEAWHNKYIATAQKLGIVNGFEDGTFGAEKQISRQEMAVILHRTASLLDLKLINKNTAIIFVDNLEIEPYANTAVSQLQQAGIINGLGNNQFAPSEKASRVQAVKMIYELLKLRDDNNV